MLGLGGRINRPTLAGHIIEIVVIARYGRQGRQHRTRTGIRNRSRRQTFVLVGIVQGIILEVFRRNSLRTFALVMRDDIENRRVTFQLRERPRIVQTVMEDRRHQEEFRRRRRFLFDHRRKRNHLVHRVAEYRALVTVFLCENLVETPQQLVNDHFFPRIQIKIIGIREEVTIQTIQTVCRPSAGFQFVEEPVVEVIVLDHVHISFARTDPVRYHQVDDFIRRVAFGDGDSRNAGYRLFLEFGKQRVVVHHRSHGIRSGKEFPAVMFLYRVQSEHGRIFDDIVLVENLRYLRQRRIFRNGDFHHFVRLHKRIDIVRHGNDRDGDKDGNDQNENNIDDRLDDADDRVAALVASGVYRFFFLFFCLNGRFGSGICRIRCLRRKLRGLCPHPTVVRTCFRHRMCRRFRCRSRIRNGTVLRRYGRHTLLSRIVRRTVCRGTVARVLRSPRRPHRSRRIHGSIRIPRLYGTFRRSAGRVMIVRNNHLSLNGLRGLSFTMESGLPQQRGSPEAGTSA